MNRADKVKDLLRRAYKQEPGQWHADPMDEHILADACSTMKHAVAAHQRIFPISICRNIICRNIMRSRKVRLAAAAAVLVTAFLAATLDMSAARAWSVEQTIAAIKKVSTLHVNGVAYWGPDSNPELVDFDFWVQFPDEDSRELKMRFECDKRIFIVQGKTAYECWPKEKVAKILNGPDIAELQIWYKSAEFSPWLTGKMLWVLRHVSDDWAEVVQHDPSTGKKQILVTCTHPSDTSYVIVIHAETGLIQSATMLKKGQSCVDAHTFTYNQGNPVDAFKVPADYDVIDEKAIEESRALFERALQSYIRERKKEDLTEEEFEALRLYKQGYEQYGSVNNGRFGAEMLYMVGQCYGELGQFDKTADIFLRHIAEYGNMNGFEDVHYCLGFAYQQLGQNEKALEAFAKCLLICEGIREPDKYPVKDARDHIAQIKAGKDGQPTP